MRKIVLWLAACIVLANIDSCSRDNHNYLTDWSIPNITLVETVPAFTNIQLSPAALNPAVAIGELINSANSSIDIEGFYFNSLAKTAFSEDILYNLKKKAESGIKIRIVLEAKMKGSALKNGLSILENYPNVTIRYNNYFDKMNGIVHAKLIIVDSKRFYMGSHNLDWIAFQLNHELGVIVDSPELSKELQKVFEADFNNDMQYQPKLAHVAATSGKVFIAVSPNFDGIASEINSIIGLIDDAKTVIDLQAMTSSNFDQYACKDYWYQLQNAIINAAKRGVEINLSISNWEFQAGEMLTHNNDYLMELKKYPNIHIRYSILPQSVGGMCIPYSEVDHAKYMVVDREHVWIGTGNLEQSYFTSSRNFSLFVMNNPVLAKEVDEIFKKMWNGSYMASYVSPVLMTYNPACD